MHIQLRVTGSTALLVLGDGNGHVRAQQQIPYTDFPMPEQTLYACWDSEHWVIMLPSEDEATVVDPMILLMRGSMHMVLA